MRTWRLRAKLQCFRPYGAVMMDLMQRSRINGPVSSAIAAKRRQSCSLARERQVTLPNRNKAL